MSQYRFSSSSDAFVCAGIELGDKKKLGYGWESVKRSAATSIFIVTARAQLKFQLIRKLFTYSRTGLRDLRTRPRNCDFTKTNFQVVLFRLGMTIAVLNYLVCTLYHLIALNIVELSTECAKPYQKSTKIIVFSIAFFVLLLHGIERTFTAFCLLGA